MADIKEELVCVCESVYDLTRGKRYAVVARDDENGQVRVRTDGGRLRLFSLGLFVDTGTSVTRVVSWRLDDPIIDVLNGRNETNNSVEVSIKLDDGSTRWCFFVTPEHLRQLLEPQVETSPIPTWSEAPAIYASHMIVVPILTEEVIEFTLWYMDRQNELFDHTLPIKYDDEDDTDDENDENGEQ